MEKKPFSFKELFDSMEYGPAPEDKSVVKQWLDEHDRKFGHFIDNKFFFPEERKYLESVDPATGDILATTVQGTVQDVETAVISAHEAFGTWSKLPGSERARHLYSFARHVQKHARLLAVLESCDNGKTIRETRDCDVPLVVRHLYYHAGWAQLFDSEFPHWKSVGVVGAIVPWNFPLMLLSWKVCPALAAGNTVVLKPATNTRLSALLLAEIAAESGLPPGVFNVVLGSGALGSALAKHPLVDKVAFTGSTEVGQLLRRLIAGSGKKLSLELGGKSPIVVFDSADLDSAVEGVVDAIWFNQGQVCSAGSRLLVQESIYDKFIEKVLARMKKLRLGNSLDKSVDMGAVVSEDQKKSIEEYVQSARDEGAQVFQIEAPSGCFYPPTLITDVGPSSRCVAEEIFGPVLVAMSFRTAKEAISLANNSMYGLGASVFSEHITLAVETAKHIKTGSVWINCHNMFDAAAGFGGYKFTPPAMNMAKFGASYTADTPNLNLRPDGGLPLIVPHIKAQELARVDRTYKLYYGGCQKRPDGNYSRVIPDPERRAFALVGEANRKDVRNAVECANKVQASWEKRSGFNRAQILFYLAENLEQRLEEFSAHLRALCGVSEEESMAEVKACITRLFTWGAFCDKYGGTIQETTTYGTVLRLHEPVGVIGVICPDEQPLLSFVSLTAPAIARGNTVVAVPSERFPTPALALYQLLDTSDMPGGVLNILTGSREHLSKYLAEHHDVDSVWYFGSLEGSTFVEYVSADNVKRTWVNYGQSRDWFDKQQGEGEELLYHSTQVKNVWLTMGDMFAN